MGMAPTFPQNDDELELPADPPIPADLPPAVRFQLDMLRWQTATIVTQLRVNSRRASEERKEVANQLAEQEEKSVERHTVLLAAVQGPTERPVPVGPLSKLLDRVGAMPQAAQLALAVVAANILLQLSGVLYTKVVGTPPPQTTVPVDIVAPAIVPTSHAASPG
jgi:hypothetical protein